MWFVQVFPSVHQSVGLPGEHRVVVLIFIGSGAGPCWPQREEQQMQQQHNDSPGRSRRRCALSCPSWMAPSSAVFSLDSPKSEIAANIKGHLRQTRSFFQYR